jgi:hypothetical protein
MALMLPALLYVAWEFIGQFSFEYINPYTLLMLVLIAFLGLALYYLGRNKKIPTTAFTSIVFISTLSCIAILGFIAAFAFDIAGATCTGLFGAKMSCVATPILILSFTVFNEMSLMVLGLLSAAGMYSLLQPRFKRIHK